MPSVREAQGRRSVGRRIPVIAAFVVIAVVLSIAALPALAADPSTPPSDPGARPAASGEPARPDTPGKGPKDKDRTPAEPITVSGTVTMATDDDGATVYRVSDGGTTYELDAGPRWFFGDTYPLQPYVGRSVTIVGETRAGSTEIDVQSVDGTALREPGKPPWAGGPKRVGERHPGWSAEKAARWADKAARMQDKFGGCWPPGHCKQESDESDDIAPTH